MVYAAIFVAATLAALILFHALPAPGAALVKARLGALDAAGSGLVPEERAQHVIERRRAKARRQQLKLLLRRDAKLAALGLTIVLLLGMAARTWGSALTFAGALALGLGILGARMVLRQWRGRRVAFQLPDTVRILADRLYDSNSLDQALESVAKEGPRAAARELARVRRALRQGRTEEQAFRQLAARNPSAEVEMLVSCLAMPQERGRRLAESLRPLQALLESRIQLAKVRARRARWLAWGTFVPLAAVMAAAGSTLSIPMLAGWTCFAIGTLLVAWVAGVKGGLA